jgi:hypothetical protein
MQKVIPSVRFDPTPLRGREEPMVALLITLLEQVKTLAAIIDGVEQTSQVRRETADYVADVMSKSFPDVRFEVHMTEVPSV